MTNRTGRGARLLTLCVCLAGATPAFSQDRTPDKILAEIKAIEMPARPADLNDRAVVQDYIQKSQKATAARSALIGELYKANPNQVELASMLPFRWSTMLRTDPDNFKIVMEETSSVIARSKDDKLVAEAYYSKALAPIFQENPPAALKDLLADYEAFAKKYPQDPRAATVLFSLSNQASSPDDKETIYQRIVKDFPNSPAVKQVASARIRLEGERRKLARVGKPFELEFTEATRGTQITMASLKGKVVVIDFWATWCGPCIAEMPNMKKLYAEFKDKGVEFIGVSLDQPKEKGGLDKLKDYVAQNKVEWPQYYQGNYWQSEFSASWGVNSIPCVFLVDADGNLASIDARGKLEKMIPEYLEKAKAKKTVSTR